MKIAEYLKKNKIEFERSGSDLVISCPSCSKALPNGVVLAELYVNQDTGAATCYACGVSNEFKDIAAKLGLKYEVEEVSEGEIEIKSKGRKRKSKEEESETPPPPPPEPEPIIDVSQFKPMSVEELLKVLGLTIKKDDENKLISFLCELSAYTENAQLNISFNAPSSSGKSYIPTEIAQLFPDEDVMEIGYCSPTAFFHDSGIYNKERNEITVDLSRKILIFLDQPHTLLLQHLRPLLSHDKKLIKLKITDKTQKGGMRTKNVLLKGFPAVIFCTAKVTVDEQESTRFILLSPQVDIEKIRSGIYEKIKKEADNKAYRLALDEQPDRKLLKERIKGIRQADIKEIKISSPEKVEQAFFLKNRKLKPRNQRDIGRILSIIKAFALFNVWFREKDGSTIIANEDDIAAGFKIWDSISESQELDLPPYVHSIFKDIIMPIWKENNPPDAIALNIPLLGISRRQITKKHYDLRGRALSDFALRQEIIPMLENAGLIAQDADTFDKRKMLIYPTTDSNTVADKNNSEASGGVDLPPVSGN